MVGRPLALKLERITRMSKTLMSVVLRRLARPLYRHLQRLQSGDLDEVAFTAIIEAMLQKRHAWLLKRGVAAARASVAIHAAVLVLSRPGLRAARSVRESRHPRSRRGHLPILRHAIRPRCQRPGEPGRHTQRLICPSIGPACAGRRLLERPIGGRPRQGRPTWPARGSSPRRAPPGLPREQPGGATHFVCAPLFHFFSPSGR